MTESRFEIDSTNVPCDSICSKCKQGTIAVGEDEPAEANDKEVKASRVSWWLASRGTNTYLNLPAPLRNSEALDWPEM